MAEQVEPQEELHESPKRSQAQMERALQKKSPAWREGYDYLMSSHPGIRYYDALLAVWLSCTKHDRGAMTSQEKFADFIGVSRAVTYQWIRRRPEIMDWAREIVEQRFDTSRIAEVDARVIQKASGTKSTPQWARLFYQRAGLLREEFDVHHSGEEGGPVEYVDVTKDELERIRRALAGEAEGGGAPG